MTAAPFHMLARSALRLFVPALLLLMLGFGQAAFAHPTGNQHQAHAAQTAAHHAVPSTLCCDGAAGELAKQADAKGCVTQCAISCSYCAPVPMPAAFPQTAQKTVLPRTAEPMHGATSAPHPRPPSYS
ncbi:hypothetical protein PV773_18910 [Mesorhizobium sp. CC13]|uniref:hypothetical protein n=1 Tax=Mesorhizobium sp. CC13 TaxID=3029194 RepID=UPI0032664491